MILGSQSRPAIEVSSTNTASGIEGWYAIAILLHINGMSRWKLKKEIQPHPVRSWASYEDGCHEPFSRFLERMKACRRNCFQRQYQPSYRLKTTSCYCEASAIRDQVMCRRELPSSPTRLHHLSSLSLDRLSLFLPIDIHNHRSER